MTFSERAQLRQRLESVPKDALADLILTVTSRIGGTGALVAALADTQNERSRQRSRRRRIAGLQRQVRA